MKRPLHQRLSDKVQGAFTPRLAIRSYIGFILMIGFIASGCQETGTAQQLQSHLAAAKSSTTATGEHIGKTKNSIERIDFKSSRALKLINEGFAK